MIWRNIKMALVSIRQGKLRSFLTMLGIIIGVTSVILVMSLGEGVKRSVSGEINELGKNLITITSGKTVTRDAEGNIEEFNVAASFGTFTLTEQDLESVRQIDGVEEAAAIMLISGDVEKGDKKIPTPFIVAVDGDISKALNLDVEFGQFFNNQTNKKVVAIGQGVEDELFDGESALGETITIRKQQFEVVAVMEEYESALDFTGTGSLNSATYIPFDVGKNFNKGNALIGEIDVKVAEGADVDRVFDDINEAILANHDGVDDFTAIKQEEILDVTDSIFDILTQAVIGLTSISLVVGGIGIMNIMLVSVTERTKEIGIRKAVGASNRHILFQFLVESIVVSMIGGAIGVLLAYLLGFVVDSQLGITPVLTTEAYGLALGVSIGVGIIFGIAPAWQASRKNPIDALRHE